MDNKILSGLNEMQKEAVCHGAGPLLILAGAGSGKTRVITHRIANLIENGVKPYNIMAITFTNKAAAEMKERVADILGDENNSVFISTFHSACVRFLRRDIERLGYGKDFTIYDTTDSKSLIKTCIKNLDLSPDIYKERAVISSISSRKNTIRSSLDELYFNPVSEYERNIENLYYEYQKRLKQNNALDFDDLILKTVELLSTYDDIREYYNDRFQYIMVDEYQDTNNSQFEFIKLLAYEHHNLCVVGDDDQSIYKFRGANIANILNFEKYYPESKVIKLEQNYRSTSQILNVANAVVAHNSYRKNKKLWTDNDLGTKPEIWEFETGYDEAEYVIKDIRDLVDSKGLKYSDFAILYRANSQSRLFEEKAVFYNLPYRLIGGLNFYARAEIKDILAYLRVIVNSDDSISLQRIINTPRRGIGATTLAKIIAFSNEHDISLYEAAVRIEEIGSISAKTQKTVLNFIQMMEEFKEKIENISIKELIEKIYEKSGYMAELMKENTDEAVARAENISELISKATDYDNQNNDGNLGAFLEEVSLVSDIDSFDGEDYVVLMTLHGSKGLEFDRVYLTGMEQGVFPSYFATQSEDEGNLEEERRLCYVGITRAKEMLKFTLANKRMMNGQFVCSKTSCFLDEIPKQMVETKGPVRHNFKLGKTLVNGTSGISDYTSKSTTGFSRISNSRVSAYSKPADSDNLSKFLQEAKSKKEALTKEKPNYTIGDKVKHIKYGIGEVSDIRDAGRDYQITVDFENGTSRILLAGFAKLVKVNQDN